MQKLRQYPAGNIVILFVLVQLGCIIASLIFPDSFRYTSPTNVQLLLRAIPQIAILAIGVNILMISGEFDLSVGATFTFSAIIMAMLFNSDVPVGWAAAIGLLTGATIGAINGLIVVRTGIPSFIATLGTMMIWRGVILLISRGQSESFRPGGIFEFLFSGAWLSIRENQEGFIQNQFIWMMAVWVGAYLLLERHGIGNHLFAVGGNRQAAVAIGVNAGGVKILAFIIAGLLAALSGIISASRVHSVSPIQGEGLELQAIAACVVGGTSLMGGKGTILGAFLGVALLFTIENILFLLRAPGYYLQLFMGILIIAAVIFNQLLKKE